MPKAKFKKQSISPSKTAAWVGAFMLALGAMVSSAPMYAVAQETVDITLPATLSWTTFNVGSAQHGYSVAIAAALQNKYGASLRVIPTGNDVSRQVPLRDGKTQFTMNGYSLFFSQEGLDDFNSKAWGPQKVRLLFSNTSRGHLGLIATDDVGIKSIADIKGKRVASIRGAANLNNNVRAMLAFAKLDWSDVEKVEVPGFNAAFEAMVNNQVDVAFVNSLAGQAARVCASNRGCVYPPLPHDDEEGWARVNNIVPWFQKSKNPIGNGIPEQFDGVKYPLPMVATYDSQDTDIVYNLTKAVFSVYDDFKDSVPGASGFALEGQPFNFIMPYHQGAVKFYKEAGVWTEEAQKHNEMLIKRQDVLAKAWKEHTAKNISDKNESQSAWQKARKAALKDAELPILED